MAKSKASNPSPARTFFVPRGALIGLIVVAVIGGGAVAAFPWYRKLVEKRYLYPPAPPQVVLKDRPTWMTDYLADEIAAAARPRGVRSALDHQLLEEAVKNLSSNPWVRQVRQVRRVYGKAPGDTLEIDCDFRVPAGIVVWDGEYFLIDTDGVRLSPAYTIKQLPDVMFATEAGRKRVNLRVIEGVEMKPPAPGAKWRGRDVLAGIGLARLLNGRACADEIWRISVANFANRIDPVRAQLVLLTQYKTEVRWGQPVDSEFTAAELTPAQKLQTMQQLRSQYGRVDARYSWIDIRFDKVMCPAAQSPSDQVSTR